MNIKNSSSYNEATKLLSMFDVPNIHNAVISMAFVKWLSCNADTKREHWESSDVLSEINSFASASVVAGKPEVASAVIEFLKASLCFNNKVTSDLPFAALAKMLSDNKDDLASLILDIKLVEQCNEGSIDPGYETTDFLLKILEKNAKPENNLLLISKSISRVIDCLTSVKGKFNQVTVCCPEYLFKNIHTLALTTIQATVSEKIKEIDFRLPKGNLIDDSDFLLIDFCSLFNETTPSKKVIGELLSFVPHVKRAVMLTTLIVKNSLQFRTWVKEAVSNGSLEAIIDLPRGSYPHASARPTVVVVSVQNSDVLFVNLSESANEVTTKNASFKETLDEAFAILQGKESELSIRVPNNEIVEADCSIDPIHYQLLAESSEHTIFLGDCAAIFRGRSLGRSLQKTGDDAGKTNFKYLSIKNLDGGEINIENLESLAEQPKIPERNKLIEGDIILPIHGGAVGFDNRIGIVGKIPEGINIFPSANVYVVRFDQTEIDPVFVMAYFKSSECAEKLKKIFKGDFAIHTSVKDLRLIRIPYLSMKEQNAIAERYHNALKDIKRAKAALAEATFKLENLFEGIEIKSDTNDHKAEE